MSDVIIYRAKRRCLILADTEKARLQFKIFWTDCVVDKDGKIFVYRDIDIIEDLTRDLNEKGLSVEVK